MCTHFSIPPWDCVFDIWGICQAYKEIFMGSLWLNSNSENDLYRSTRYRCVRFVLGCLLVHSPVEHSSILCNQKSRPTCHQVDYNGAVFQLFMSFGSQHFALPERTRLVAKSFYSTCLRDLLNWRYFRDKLTWFANSSASSLAVSSATFVKWASLW